jgi:hypothetical protein
VYSTFYKQSTPKNWWHDQKSGRKWGMYKGVKPFSVVKLWSTDDFAGRAGNFTYNSSKTWARKYGEMNIGDSDNGYPPFYVCN